MDLLDVVIVLLLIAAAASGWRRGLTWVGLSFLGLAIGVLIGAAVAPPLARQFGGRATQSEALIATGIFLTCVALVQGVGTAVGYQVRIAALRSRLAQADSVMGSALGVIGVLIAAWYLGLTFAQSPFTRLDEQIQGSAIIRALDRLAPRPPAFLARIESIIRGSQFPNPFAGLAPQLLPPVDIPANVSTPGTRRAAAVTSKVLSRSSCGIEAGSSWPLTADEMVTNAHVVAGASNVTVQTPDGHVHDATVVLFDPEVDVAVLRVGDLGIQPLTMAASDPQRGQTGAVIGYPGGGGEQVVPAAVRGTEDAVGRDIYNSNLVRRRIEVLQAQVIPGNSGGPIVDLNGTVIGLVFAASTVDPGEGYALAPSEIAPDLAAARTRTGAVSTQDCTG